jgi:hypothetical protein
MYAYIVICLQEVRELDGFEDTVVNVGFSHDGTYRKCFSSFHACELVRNLGFRFKFYAQNTEMPTIVDPSATKNTLALRDQ